MTDELEYDVAFSFTQQDEALAGQLNDLISDRMSTFLYSERQKEIAGTDGQDSFSEVYGRKARIVVILYRKEWGTTRWTGVEMNAIRTRAFNDGFDFTIFIPTEDKPATPAWLPPTRLYVGLERWGVVGAAAVIEQRVTEAGGKAQQESVLDRAARLARSNDLKKAQQQFDRSNRGYQEGNDAYKVLGAALETGCEAIRPAGVNMGYRESQHYHIVNSGAVNLITSWYPHYNNSIEDIFMVATFYKGFPKLPGFMPSFNEARQLQSMKYRFGLLREGHTAYIETSGRKREFEPAKLAEQLLSDLMDLSEKNPYD